MTYPISNFGFIILNPEKNIAHLKTTVESLQKLNNDLPYVCIVPSNTPADSNTKMSEHCKIHKGGATYSSMINTGLKKLTTPWQVIVFAGTWVNPYLENLIKFYLTDEKDILFPVLKTIKPEQRLTRLNFSQGSLNGVVLHKSCLKTVGEFPERSFIESPMIKDKPILNDLELIKLEWANMAMAKGYRFKAILGCSIC